MVLSRIFEGQDSGFFVDVGAHHHMRLSNTYYFYLQGWRGINIEARPDIDFLSIYVERMDLHVLKTNDWPRFLPRMVLVEDLESSGVDVMGKSDVAAFMLDHGYSFHCRTSNTLFFAKGNRTRSILP